MRTIVFLLALLGVAGVHAESYPSRPVKLVVPWPPGQSTDVVARTVSERLANVLGQPIVIENKAGAAGTIGTDFAAKSAPDGYTLLAGSGGPISISPSVQRVPYDASRDFEPICLISNSPYVLVTHASLPSQTADEFVALLRQHPGEYTYASSGVASTSHLIAEMFNSAANLAARHVPYKGSAAALADIIAGHVHYGFETASTALPHVKAGRLKALGATGDRRAIAFPDLPTLAEAAGLPGFDARGWVGLLAPAGMSRDVHARLASACRTVLDSQEIQDLFRARGTEMAPVSPAEFAGFIRTQNARFAAIAKQARIRLD